MDTRNKEVGFRDYDKEPIVIKKLDDLFWLIALGILLICSLVQNFDGEYKFRFYMKKYYLNDSQS